MRINLFSMLFLCQMMAVTHAQQIPEGYILQYQQSFTAGEALADFNLGNPASWGIYNTGTNFYLHFGGSPDPARLPVLPCCFAVLNNQVYGDFILEADVMPLIDTGGFGEICLFLGLKDNSTYYCIWLANQGDNLMHGLFLVKDSIPKPLNSQSSLPVVWKPNKWQKIRVERNIVKRTILVYLDNMKQPLLQTRDYELVMGSVGFGSFSGPGSFDNIRIWAPTVIRND